MSHWIKVSILTIYGFLRCESFLIMFKSHSYGPFVFSLSCVLPSYIWFAYTLISCSTSNVILNSLASGNDS